MRICDNLSHIQGKIKAKELGFAFIFIKLYLKNHSSYAMCIILLIYCLALQYVTDYKLSQKTAPV